MNPFDLFSPDAKKAILDAAGRGEIPDGEVTLVISDRPGAYALERAARAGIPTLEISKKAITLTVDPKEKTYSDPDPELTAHFGDDDLVGNDEITYTLTRDEGENAGEYDIHVTLEENPNYEVTIAETEPAKLTVKPIILWYMTDRNTTSADTSLCRTMTCTDRKTSDTMAAGPIR